MDLYLPVKGEYFHEIKSGRKNEEYRIFGSYWFKRLNDRKYDKIIVTLGYPKKEDKSRRLVFPYKGFETKIIIHKHFGNFPVKVFAIKLSEES